MSQSITLHGVTNIKIEENQREAENSEGCKKIIFELEDSKDFSVTAFGDFETETVSEVVR
jgi:hypothetical protein